MCETLDPRKCFTDVSSAMASHAGGEDQTQTTFGISRGDAGTGFLSECMSKGILPKKPSPRSTRMAWAC